MHNPSEKSPPNLFLPQRCSGIYGIPFPEQHCVQVLLPLSSIRLFEQYWSSLHTHFDLFSTAL